MKQETKWKRKIKEIQKLAKSAIIDKPKRKPQKGFVYIKDVEPGQLVETESNEKAIILEHTDSATVVYANKLNDSAFKRIRWAGETEVKIKGE
tara:strand:+ start:329 stop:607 length:279 start_codon:yes stop_codon:yes gene_type:complete